MTRRTYRCQHCQATLEKTCTLSEQPIPTLDCPTCSRPAAMTRFFGQLAVAEVLLNLGYRGEQYYPTKEDARIAQFQFENL